jgi:hypothetical protein
MNGPRLEDFDTTRYVEHVFSHKGIQAYQVHLKSINQIWLPDKDGSGPDYRVLVDKFVIHFSPGS